MDLLTIGPLTGNIDSKAERNIDIYIVCLFPIFLQHILIKNLLKISYNWRKLKCITSSHLLLEVLRFLWLGFSFKAKPQLLVLSYLSFLLRPATLIPLYLTWSERENFKAE